MRNFNNNANQKRKRKSIIDCKYKRQNGMKAGNAMHYRKAK